MKPLADLLPPKLAEIAEVIGIDAAMKLSAAHPGLRIHVPKRAPETHSITIAIGLKAAQALCEIYGGSDVVIPMATRLHKERLRLAIIDRLKAGASAPEVAREFGVHQFTVYRLKAEQSRSEQQQLF